MTGPFASTGRQVEAGIKASMALNGDTAGGKTIELVLRDDAGTADQTRRIAQELVVNDGVKMLVGFGLTPLAMSVAPVLNQAKVPAIITSATTSAIIVEQKARKVLPLTDDVIVLERGAVTYRDNSAALLAEPARLDSLLSV